MSGMVAPRSEEAAILMMLFGEEAAAMVMRHLSPIEVQHLGTAMYGVREVGQTRLDEIVDNFLSLMSRETGVGQGASAYIQSVMTQALGQDKAQSVISRINPRSTERPIELLDWMDARSIAELIEDEHPQIMALVVACLEYGLAASVVALLPEDTQTDVVRRVAELNTVPPEALRDLEQVLQRKFKASTSSRASQLGGVKAAARIMNHTRTEVEQRILRDIRKDDKVLMQSIQDNILSSTISSNPMTGRCRRCCGTWKPNSWFWR